MDYKAQILLQNFNYSVNDISLKSWTIFLCPGNQADKKPTNHANGGHAPTSCRLNLGCPLPSPQSRR